MTERHDDERMSYKREREAKEKSAREDADRQHEVLRSRDSCLVSYDISSKIESDFNAKLLSIQKDYDENNRIVLDIQRKARVSFERDYNDAIVARSATTTVDAAHHSPAVNDSNMANHYTVARDQAASSEKTLSCKVQREFINGKERCILQYRTNNLGTLQMFSARNPKLPRIDTSVNHFPTPAPTLSASDDQPQGPRTVTFDEVYQDGQAEHKDHIIEYPPKSNQWYILKCEEHHLRFKQRPLRGAAKHMDSRAHGFKGRNADLALQHFGYRVIGCDAMRADINNNEVSRAVAEGYQPIGVSPFSGTP